MRISNEKLKLLVERLDLVPQERLEAAYNYAEKNKQPLAEILVDSDLISDDNLGQVIADELGYDFIDLDSVAINDEVLQLIPKVMAKKQKVIAFDKDEKGIKLAMANPGNLSVINLLEKKSGQEVNIYYTTPENISSALVHYQKGIQKEFTEIIQENISQAKKGSKAEDLPVIKIVDSIIEYAFDNKASDIHVEPGDKKTLVRFRIDGILHDIIDLPKEVHDLFVTRVKIMAKLRTDEHRSAQDGKIRQNIGEKKLDVRVSIIPIVEGEKIVMRLLSEHSGQFSLEDLGMGGEDLIKVKKEYSKSYGMILATGPTGSGKSTSLYAMIKILNQREVNISTIEDPVEYDIEGVNQIQVNPKTNLTFANGLRSILRQDPDVIMVGEIRDEETADIAINSAMTGHLVLSSLHTNDAPTSLPRFLEMNIEPFLIASTVNLVMAQRLVRRNCKQCIVSEQVTLKSLKEKFSPELIEKHLGGGKDSVRIYHGKGCPVCGNMGYLGRIGIFEVMVMSEEIRKLVMARANADEIRKQAMAEGMKTMVEDGFKKVLSGVTTIEEVLRATRE
ncbi:type II/IV secretion system protein [Candidatus Falkowbacteria bacterium]|nr:type II/IV secretion system protein [Candidatus Falkowbacteria bacterium]